MTEKTDSAMLMSATLHALQQGLQEACARLGVADSEFSTRFQACAQWHYDRLLQAARDDARSFVGEINLRPENHPAKDATPPRILPDN